MKNRVEFSAAVENEMSLTLPALSVNEGMARTAVAAFCAQLNPTALELADIKCAVSEVDSRLIQNVPDEYSFIVCITSYGLTNHFKEFFL